MFDDGDQLEETNCRVILYLFRSPSRKAARVTTAVRRDVYSVELHLINGSSPLGLSSPWAPFEHQLPYKITPWIGTLSRSSPNPSLLAVDGTQAGRFVLRNPHHTALLSFPQSQTESMLRLPRPPLWNAAGCRKVADQELKVLRLFASPARACGDGLPWQRLCRVLVAPME